MPTLREAFKALPNGELEKTALVELLTGVRENQVRTEERVTKSVTALFVLVAICELLNRAAVSEFSFAGLKVTDLALVRKLLPLGIAYCFYCCLSFLAFRRLLWECHWQAVQLLHPCLVQHDLWRFQNPPSTFETENILAVFTSGCYKTAIRNLSVPLKIAIGIGPIIFESYAFFLAFCAFGFVDPILWVSLLLSVLFVAQGALFVVGTSRLAPPNPA